MSKLTIPIILGTARKDRASEKAARFAQAEASRIGFESDIVDVREHLWGAETIASWIDDDRAHAWRDIAARADGFIIVTPEYNHGYPGELKILLDSAHKEYTQKPVGLCGVSSGSLGGARVVEHIKPVLIEMNMVPTHEAMYISHAADALTEDGVPHDENMRKYMHTLLEELQTYARIFREARDNNTSS